MPLCLSSFGNQLMKMLVFAISITELLQLLLKSWLLQLHSCWHWRGHSASRPVLLSAPFSDSCLSCFPDAAIGHSVQLLPALMCFQTRAPGHTSTWKCSMSVSLTVCILIYLHLFFSVEIYCGDWASLELVSCCPRASKADHVHHMRLSW